MPTMGGGARIIAPPPPIVAAGDRSPAGRDELYPHPRPPLLLPLHSLPQCCLIELGWACHGNISQRRRNSLVWKESGEVVGRHWREEIVDPPVSSYNIPPSKQVIKSPSMELNAGSRPLPSPRAGISHDPLSLMTDTYP